MRGALSYNVYQIERGDERESDITREAEVEVRERDERVSLE